MKSLEELRAEIDEIDTQLVDLFVKRMEVVDQIGLVKKEENVPVMRYGREVHVLDRVKSQVKPELQVYVEKVFNTLFEVSKSRQCELLEE